MEPEAVFTEETVRGKPLIVCTIGEHRGTARLLSDGLEAAKGRAETQARGKAEHGPAE
jgi:hypothetical protein